MPLFRSSNKNKSSNSNSHNRQSRRDVPRADRIPEGMVSDEIQIPNVTEQAASTHQGAASGSGSIASSSTSFSYIDQASVASGASGWTMSTSAPPPRPPPLFTPESLAVSNTAPSDVPGQRATSRPAHTPWPVRDTALQPIPPLYPPLDRRCCTFVDDASPSVVAVRIADCLRRRSIVADYDEENVTATAMTVDRCQFVIQLHRAKGDFAHGGIVVECMRTTGSTLSFHRHCRAILAAAKGLSTGEEDDKPARMRRVLEFRQLKRDNRLVTKGRNVYINNDAETASKVQIALERVQELLRKDRLDCQTIGMESLVALTDTDSSGVSVAKCATLKLMQDPSLLLKYVLNPTAGIDGEFENDGYDDDVEEKSDLSEMELQHAGQMRSMALRVLSNSLDVASEHDLWSKVPSTSRHSAKHGQGHPFLSAKVQQVLMGDLQGAQRPASVATSAALASPHEAALAAACLRHVAKDNSDDDEINESLLERLEAARRVPHAMLQRQAAATHAAMTEDVRTC